MNEIKRKPILTVTNRRNAENHPEFLDTEALLERFEPLLKSIHRRFMSYQDVFTNADDSSDLYSQIVFEFLKLRQTFDPKRGVDFTGYIKFHLQQRVYHYVIKHQKVVQSELSLADLTNDYDDKPVDTENLIELADENSDKEFERIDAIASIPWKSLSENQSHLIRRVLIDHKSLEEIAKESKVTLKSVKQDLDELCEFLIKLQNPDSDE